MGSSSNRQGCMVVAVVIVLAATGLTHADLMPVPDVSGVAPRRFVAPATPGPVLSEAWDSAEALPALSELVDRRIDLRGGETSEDPAVHILVDRSGSLGLCLYALVGLGVFRSCHWVKRSSLGFIPEWYHSGAPQQIGHSHAVGSDAFCFAAVCFVQPDGEVEPPMPRQRRGAIMSLWRCSQFTPFVLASRAPPPTSLSKRPQPVWATMTG